MHLVVDSLGAFSADATPVETARGLDVSCPSALREWEALWPKIQMPEILGTEGMLHLIWVCRDAPAALEELQGLVVRSSRRGLQDAALLALVDAPLPTAALAERLRAVLHGEPAWSRRLIGALVLARAWLRLHRQADAATAIRGAFPAYRGLARLCAKRHVRPRPDLPAAYRETCVRFLESLEPPRRVGQDPVAQALRAAEEMRPRLRLRPDRAIDALDALITIGRSTLPGPMARRVAREIARMLGARVLFLRRGRRLPVLRPQAEHTLSTWTVLRMARAKEMRAFRVKPRPEFWRPEQRRPRGLLVFPLGDGVACLARGRRFRRRDLAATRTVLRFLEARLSRPQAPALAARAPAEPIPSLAGEGLIGACPAWQEVLQKVVRVADAGCGVLLLGETGTGKERVARALHAVSRRAHAAFVAVNCGAVPASLLASELFGHVRGAFTGAEENRAGLLAQAHRGTLFLDEAADMPGEMQVALLRALEEKVVRPLGSVRTQPADVRVVTACSRDLDAEAAAGRFRLDLLHRLDVVRIDLPPLRRRREDIPLLVAHVLGRIGGGVRLHPDALPVLLEHDWPGNVRELENVLRAACLLATHGEITPALARGVLDQRRNAQPRPSPAPVTHPRHTEVLAALGQGWLSSAEVARRLGVSVRTVSRDMATLAERGLVLAMGEARARRYAVARPGEPSRAS